MSKLTPIEKWARKELDKLHFIKFLIIIEKENAKNNYFAYSPELPSVYCSGKTIEETKRNMREAVKIQLKSLIKDDLSIPSWLHRINFKKVRKQ